MMEEDFVAALYRTLLSRDPDENGLATYVGLLKEGKAPEDIIRTFLRSAEFRAKISRVVNLYPLDGAPPIDVELDLSSAQEAELWSHVARSWAQLGTAEPYWSVLTGPQYKSAELGDAETLDTFYKTGQNSLARVDRWLARNGIVIPETATCAEYGCGVGRCTIWLARRYARVLAFDISEPHLKLARARAEAEVLTNIEFIHVRGEADLLKIRDVDFFFSVIVLQHNPPPLILSILKHAFAGTKQDGTLYFQLPTYSTGYSFKLRSYLADLAAGKMEMHCVPQRAVFELAAAHGWRPLEVSPDNMTGSFGRWISTSFLMTKQRNDLVLASGWAGAPVDMASRRNAGRLAESG